MHFYTNAYKNIQFAYDYINNYKIYYPIYLKYGGQK